MGDGKADKEIVRSVISHYKKHNKKTGMSVPVFLLCFFVDRDR